MREAVAGYVRTAIASAVDEDPTEWRGGDIRELRKIVSGEVPLHWFAPFQREYGEDCRQEYISDAFAQLCDRDATNADLCSGVDSWASAFGQEVAFHVIPPVHRLAAIAWLTDQLGKRPPKAPPRAARRAVRAVRSAHKVKARSRRSR
jgi:hypothetical protein